MTFREEEKMPYKNKEDRNANHAKRMADPEYHSKHNSKNKTWSDANPDKVHRKNQALYSSYTPEQMQERAKRTAEWRVLNPGKVEAFNEQRKIRVLAHYSGKGTVQCAWEGCTVCDLDMLSIDHVNNDGAKDRGSSDRRRTGSALYLALEKEGYPEGFQTLCHNHQWKKEIVRRRELRIRTAEEKLVSLKTLESNTI
jgi:hypothetical protein